MPDQLLMKSFADARIKGKIKIKGNILSTSTKWNAES
jgi:hypothetical protein